MSVHAGIGQNTKDETQKMKHTRTVTPTWSATRIYLPGDSLGLTFAGLDALNPHVVSVSVAGTSTILIPSTPRSATTDSARFLERTALRARHIIGRGGS